MARRRDVPRTIVFLVLLLAARLPLCIAVGALPVATALPSHNGNSAAASVTGGVYALATVKDIAGPAVADSVGRVLFKLDQFDDGRTTASAPTDHVHDARWVH